MATARTLWCRFCQVGLAWVGPVDPIVCPSCQFFPAKWTEESPFPTMPYVLNAADRRYLRKLRIAAEDPAPIRTEG